MSVSLSHGLEVTSSFLYATCSTRPSRFHLRKAVHGSTSPSITLSERPHIRVNGTRGKWSPADLHWAPRGGECVPSGPRFLLAAGLVMRVRETTRADNSFHRLDQGQWGKKHVCSQTTCPRECAGPSWHSHAHPRWRLVLRTPCLLCSTKGSPTSFQVSLKVALNSSTSGHGLLHLPGWVFLL